MTGRVIIIGHPSEELLRKLTEHNIEIVGTEDTNDSILHAMPEQEVYLIKNCNKEEIPFVDNEPKNTYRNVSHRRRK